MHGAGWKWGMSTGWIGRRWYVVILGAVLPVMLTAFKGIAPKGKLLSCWGEYVASTPAYPHHQALRLSMKAHAVFTWLTVVPKRTSVSSGQYQNYMATLCMHASKNERINVQLRATGEGLQGNTAESMLAKM